MPATTGDVLDPTRAMKFVLVVVVVVEIVPPPLIVSSSSSFLLLLEDGAIVRCDSRLA